MLMCCHVCSPGCCTQFVNVKGLRPFQGSKGFMMAFEVREGKSLKAVFDPSKVQAKVEVGHTHDK